MSMAIALYAVGASLGVAIYLLSLRCVISAEYAFSRQGVLSIFILEVSITNSL